VANLEGGPVSLDFAASIRSMDTTFCAAMVVRNRRVKELYRMKSAGMLPE